MSTLKSLQIQMAQIYSMSNATLLVAWQMVVAAKKHIPANEQPMYQKLKRIVANELKARGLKKE